MNRVVEAALDAGITQFLDLGAGIPTIADSETPASRRPPANVHDLVTEQLGAGGRVVYVDHESVAAAHARITLGTDDHGHGEWAGVVQNDMRDPQGVMTNTVTKSLLDLSQPVCVLIVSVLHFLSPADRPAEVIAGYRSYLPAGSWVAMSHAASSIPEDPELQRQLTQAAGEYSNTQNPGWLRDRDAFEALFAGTELLEPGLVHLPDWRPTETDEVTRRREEEVRGAYWCGVGELRA